MIVDGLSVIVKRDDVIHRLFSGNKAYKLYWLIDHLKYHPSLTKIVSFGGAQSNYMLAVAQFCRLNQLQFDYWLKPLPRALKDNPNGNLRVACNLGMKVYEMDYLNKDKLMENYRNNSQVLLLTQGGAQQEAEVGLKICADHINNYFENIAASKGSIFIASGTGVSAFYLRKHLKKSYLLYTTPCVGDKEYLLAQMKSLAKNTGEMPIILDAKRKYHFGQCYKEHLAMYNHLKVQTGIEFDLLYDPLGWQVLFDHYQQLQKPIIYVHCGGVTGNISMLKRYQYFLKNKISQGFN
ncbi:1-aminocyclopropane-1-carboxylate deaminase [Fastidiosibacter lacustris]|uniref:1-aminocyclopropane-1-carboxylate deaminase n=1 Tax=Fastidiosibacter lacustris TaxID=2056695 RepID=UPI000E34592D|nr:1-aminocyclopropane-1-carboxylate deaminase [Fastidiosibacter lacustris]